MSAPDEAKDFMAKCPTCGKAVRGGRFWTGNEIGRVTVRGEVSYYETTTVGFLCCVEWDVPVGMCLRRPADRP